MSKNNTKIYLKQDVAVRLIHFLQAEIELGGDWTAIVTQKENKQGELTTKIASYLHE